MTNEQKAEKIEFKGIKKDLTGNRYGKLLVLRYSHTKGENRYWECICDCGNTHFICTGSLNFGTKSCGCLVKERPNSNKSIHKRLAKIYSGMKTRCYNENAANYSNYGERGIKICKEWLQDFKIFHEWAMNNGYDEKLTIDRKDVNGNYEPSNCRWATQSEQNNNRRNSLYYEYEGVKRTIGEWSEILNIKPDSLKVHFERLKYTATKSQMEQYFLGRTTLNHIYFVSSLNLNLNHVKYLEAVIEGVEEVPIDKDYKKLEKIGMLFNGEVTDYGKTFLSKFYEVTPTTIIIKKKGEVVEDVDFNKWWDTYPVGGNFSENGVSFTSVRTLRCKKAECRTLLNKILSEKVYTVDQLIEALKNEISLRREKSIETGKNQFEYMKASFGYLFNRNFEAYINTPSESKTKKSLNFTV